MDNKRSFSRIYYRINVRYLPKSDLGFTDECSGSFVCNCDILTLSRYARCLHSYIPHWCLKIDFFFEYDNSSPISQIEFSKRICDGESLRKLLLKSLLQTTVINLFTNSYHLCLRK